MEDLLLAFSRASEGFELLRTQPTQHWVEVCRRAADLFLQSELDQETPPRYLERLAQTSGMPYALGKMNMDKLAFILRSYLLSQMPRVAGGKTDLLALARQQPE